MSKYRKISVELKSESALVAALNDVAEKFHIKFESHATPVHLIGYQGDLREETAEYVIRRGYVGPSANDIGFARQPDGSFKAIVSDFDAGQGDYADGVENAKFTYFRQRYAYHATVEQAESLGYQVYEETSETGEIVLNLMRAY